MTSKSLSAFAVLGLASVTQAFWRMECRGITGVARIDPIVDPGKVSGHAHTIHGSSGFGMGSTYEDLVNGQCTSCAVKQDKSAYWTPNMYFQDAVTGEVTPVPQIGGMLAYYLPRGENVKAFPPGFEMIAGSNYRREYTVGDAYSPDPPQSSWAGLKQTGQSDLEQRAIGFNCLNYHRDAEPALYRHYMPDKDFTDANCPDGLRLELMFPSCWNGDKKSDNHKSHVAYPDLVGNGNCPESHPQRLVTLFYETIFDTNDPQFHGKNGSFVMANGDRTGYGYHGDFITGWDESFLQEAIDTCTNESGALTDCNLFVRNGPLLTEAEQRECKFDMPSILKAENAVGKAMNQLPGGIQIQDGPQSASPPGAVNPVEQATSSPTTKSSSIPSPSTSSVAEALESGGAFIEAPTSATPASPDFGALDVSTTTSIITSTSLLLPTTTSAPQPTSEPGVNYEVVSTQTITSAGKVQVIVWMQPVVYVTVDDYTTVTIPGPAPTNLKARNHVVKHRHHGRGH